MPFLQKNIDFILIFLRERSAKAVAGICATILGLLGLIYCTSNRPQTFQFIYETAKWAFATTFFMTIALSGILGIRPSKWKASHLKVIDLIWVLASAVGVAFAIVQVTQSHAESYRKVLESNIASSRATATRMVAVAFRTQCVEQISLAPTQCEKLRRLGIMLDSSGYLAPEVVGAVCPRPIRIDAPPLKLSAALIEGCIQANFAAYAADDPLLLDRAHVEKWNRYTELWPLFMIFLVSLRISKSVAEVFWGIK